MVNKKSNPDSISKTIAQEKLLYLRTVCTFLYLLSLSPLFAKLSEKNDKEESAVEVISTNREIE